MPRPARRAASDGVAIAGALMCVPMVVALRIPLLAQEARASSKLGTETMRAGVEKAEAMAEGLFAAQLSLVESVSQFWLEAASGRIPAVFNGAAAERAVHAALRPAGKRVRANFRRLSAAKKR